MSNVLASVPTGERFSRAGGFALAQHWAEHVVDLDRRRLRSTARVRVTAALRERLPDHPSHPLTAVVRATGAPPGDVVVDLPIEAVDRAVADLVAFGAGVEVLAPGALRDGLARLAAEVSAVYAGP